MVDYTAEVAAHVIDGYRYTSTKMPAMRAYTLLMRCIQVLGPRGMRAVVQRHAPGFAEVAPALVVEAAKAIDIYGALYQVSTGMQQDPELARDLLAQVKVDKLRPANVSGGDIAPNFDTHFTGEMPHLFRVLEFAAVHNYLGFTLGPRFRVGPLTSAAPATDGSSDSPSPSEGSTTPQSPDSSST